MCWNVGGYLKIWWLIRSTVISYDIFHDKPFFIIKIPGSANIKIKMRPIFINYQKGNGLWYIYIFFFHNVNWFIFALWWFCLYSMNNDWEIPHDLVCLETMTSFFTKLMKMNIYFYQIKDIHFLICDLHKTVLLIIMMLMMINSAQRYDSRYGNHTLDLIFQCCANWPHL